MKAGLKLLFWGAFISFLGSLPLGTLNITATNLSVQRGSMAALSFAWGSLLVELICVWIALMAVDWVSMNQKIFRVFEWITAGVIMALAIGSMVAALRMEPAGLSFNISNEIHPFTLGLLLSALNPLHIPFWFGWSNLLANKGILVANRSAFPVYSLGIGVGTIAGFAVFIFGGNYLINRLKDQQDTVNWTIGIVLFITALIQIGKLCRRKAVTANVYN